MNAGRRQTLFAAGAAALMANLEGVDVIPSARAYQLSNMDSEPLRISAFKHLPGCVVQDISDSGDELLLRCTDRPIQMFATRKGGLFGSGETRKEELELVEAQTGEVVHRVSVEGAISRATLTPSRRSGFVNWWQDSSLQLGHWNSSLHAPILAPNHTISDAWLTPLDDTRAVTLASSKGSGTVLSLVRLPNMESLITVPVDPSDRNGVSVYSSLSRDRELWAHCLRGPHFQVFVIRTRDLKVVAQIPAPEGLAYWRTALSSDGAVLAADAHILKTGLQSDPRSLHEVHIYDVASGKLINRFPIDGRQGLTFSSDGRLLATGRRAVTQDDNERRVQAIASIHEVKSGRKLAETKHPEVVEPRENPFIGHIVMLGFLSGDRQLVTSTQETRIWRIDRG